MIPSFVKITGWKPILDAQATGQAAKDYRKARGVSGRRVARVMGIVPSFLCDMENGHASWTVKKACAYHNAVEQLRGNLHLTAVIKSRHGQQS